MSNLNDRMLWGWSRYILGLLQMALSIGALFRIATIGLDELAWILAFCTMTLTFMSRVVFRGKKAPVAD